MADLCTYFFRRIHDEMAFGTKAGLVGTNTIRQNHSRQASLDYIFRNSGRIYNAWSTYEWIGEAAVHVSIVNWEKGDSGTPVELDGKAVTELSSRLTAEKIEMEPRKLDLPNSITGYQGVIPRFNGFVLDEKEAMYLIEKDTRNQMVIRPFLIARAFQTNPHSKFDRYIIDFNEMPQEIAEEFSEVIEIVKKRVKPKRKALKDVAYNRYSRLYWWRYHNNRTELRSKLSELQKYIAVARVSKEPHFNFIDSNILPDNTIVAIPSSDYYLCGVLNSRFHKLWAWMQGSTLKGDLRYTPTSILETFPFPANVDNNLRKKISEITQEILDERSRLMEIRQIGLTKLYNANYPSITKLHYRLDHLVCEAYHWSWKEVQSDQQFRKKLLMLNLGSSLVNV